MGKIIHVLVIAHPDDESMFFVPTIKSLVSAGKTLHILCLTTGDYDGLGRQREKEMIRAGRLLGVEKVIVKNDLKDHPSERWPIPSTSEAIQRVLLENLLDHQDSDCESLVLISFDQLGVSGHVNHIDTFCGVCDIVSKKTISFDCSSTGDKKIIPIEGLVLESEQNLLLKYFPVLSWIILIISFFGVSLGGETATNTTSRPCHVCYRWNEPWLNWKAMATHESQFVWYRRLFVVFSCYTYVNKLKPLPSP